MKRKPKTSLQKYTAKKKRLSNQAKALWQELIRVISPNCEGHGIGCTGKTQAGHHFVFVSASNHLRFDLKNGIGLCTKCHYALHNTGRAGIVYLNIIQGRSKEWKEYIDKNSQVRVSTTLGWYKKKFDELTKLKNN
uniref:Putative lambda recombination protein n=1 Tax=viral metagenome TaxID=1070528 RepID=A0A6H2A4A6_9ZZZZ